MNNPVVSDSYIAGEVNRFPGFGSLDCLKDSQNDENWTTVSDLLKFYGHSLFCYLLLAHWHL